MCFSVYVMFVQNDCGVMVNVVFCQYCFQLFIRNFVLQWFVFYFVGIDVVSIGNMVDKVKFRSVSGCFNDFLVIGRFCCNFFILLQVVQLLWINQLFKVWQFLQMGRFVQCVIQNGDMCKICFLQLCFDGVDIFVIIVQCYWGIGFQVMLFDLCVELFGVYFVELVSREV